MYMILLSLRSSGRVYHSNVWTHHWWRGVPELTTSKFRTEALVTVAVNNDRNFHIVIATPSRPRVWFSYNRWSVGSFSTSKTFILASNSAANVQVCCNQHLRLFLMQQVGSSLDVASTFDPWVEQIGFPVVTVTTGPDTNLVLTQTRFLNDPELDPDQPESPHGWVKHSLFALTAYMHTSCTGSVQ